MRKRMLGLGLLMVLATFFGGNVWAGVIVDTGVGWSSCDGMSLASFYGTSPGQFLAGKFTIDKAYTITSVAGWLATTETYSGGGSFTGTGGSIDVRIYPHDLDFPYGSSGTTSLGTYVSTLGSIDVPANSSPDWYSLTGLTYDLVAGTYWVAFAPQDYGGFVGIMPSWNPPDGVGDTYPLNQGPNPLTLWAHSLNGYDWAAFNAGSLRDFNNADIAANYGIGVRITDSSAVPLPSTLLLLGSGLLGLAGWRRRK